MASPFLSHDPLWAEDDDFPPDPGRKEDDDEPPVEGPMWVPEGWANIPAATDFRELWTYCHPPSLGALFASGCA
jgi:hypothetical protein